MPVPTARAPFTAAAVSAVLAAVSLVGCDGFDAPAPVPFDALALRAALDVPVTGTTVIRDERTWTRFWAAHNQGFDANGQPLSAPAVDFTRQTVVGAFYGGSFHAGCNSAVDLVETVREVGGTVEVQLGRLPSLGVCRAVVHPIDLVVIDVPPSETFDLRFTGHLPR